MSETFQKKVVEDIVTPGMIVRDSAGMAKNDDRKIRVQMFSISSGGEDAGTCMQLEALLNRSDVVIIDFHKFTFQNTYNVTMIYSEPLVTG